MTNQSPDFGGPEKNLWALVFIAAIKQGETHQAAEMIARYALNEFRRTFPRQPQPPFLNTKVTPSE
jgi:hypothetical protein